MARRASPRSVLPVPARRLAAVAAMTAAAGLLFSADAQPRDDVAALGGELVYGGDADFPPYEYLDANGRPAGLNVDLVRAVARRERLQLRIELHPWPEVVAGIRSGRFDLAAMYRGDARATFVDYAIAHELVYHELFVGRGSGFAPQSLADLAGRRVAVQRDTRAEDAVAALEPAPTLLRYESEPRALRSLASGQVEAAIVTQAVGRPFVERQDLAGKIGVSGPPVLLTEYAFVTAKNRPALLDRINRGVQAAKASGEYDALYDRWIRPDRSAERLRYAAWALGAAAVLVAGVVAWNRTLRRRVAEQTAALRRQVEEQARAEAAIAQRDLALKQASRLEGIGRLAAGVAHDFNNVVTVIVSHASMLKEDLAGRAEAEEAEGILAASDRAKRLTRQILALARDAPAEVERLDLGALVEGMRRMLDRLVGSGIHVEVAPAPGPLPVEASPTHLEQILLNLASNARDAMPAGGRLRVSLSRVEAAAARAPGFDPVRPCAALTVEDTGAGMDAATQARIFEPFFTTKAGAEGTGLGLATVFANVHRLSGRVTVRSAPGAGSTFTVFIPLAGPAPAAVAPVAAEGARLDGLRVLVVDDDAAVLAEARRILAAAGAEVFSAGAVEAARAAVPAGPPLAVLVTDVVMPEGTGPALASDLRARWPGLRVLYLSGQAHAGLAVERGTAFLGKPFSPAALVAAVARLSAARAT